MSGTIKKLVAERGFGFITAEDGNDYFFHRSGTIDFDRLDTGAKVSFVTEPSPKGPATCAGLSFTPLPPRRPSAGNGSARSASRPPEPSK